MGKGHEETVTADLAGRRVRRRRRLTTTPNPTLSATGDLQDGEGRRTADTDDDGVDLRGSGWHVPRRHLGREGSRSSSPSRVTDDGIRARRADSADDDVPAAAWGDATSIGRLRVTATREPSRSTTSISDGSRTSSWLTTGDDVRSGRQATATSGKRVRSGDGPAALIVAGLGRSPGRHRDRRCEVRRRRW